MGWIKTYNGVLVNSDKLDYILVIKTKLDHETGEKTGWIVNAVSYCDGINDFRLCEHDTEEEAQAALEKILEYLQSTKREELCYNCKTIKEWL